MPGAYHRRRRQRSLVDSYATVVGSVRSTRLHRREDGGLTASNATDTMDGNFETRALHCMSLHRIPPTRRFSLSPYAGEVRRAHVVLI